VAQLRFGVAGCQRYDDGYFTAYRQIATERFDCVFHSGDYSYEYRVVRPGERLLPVVRVMPDEPDESYTLDDYRQRYALYKSDPDLQSAHFFVPGLVGIILQLVTLFLTSYAVVRERCELGACSGLEPPNGLCVIRAFRSDAEAQSAQRVA
jgi:hypothetical protein